MLSLVTEGSLAIASHDELSAVASGLTVLVLILLLVGREVAMADEPRLALLARNLTLVIAPLLALFGAIVVSRWAGLG